MSGIGGALTPVFATLRQAWQLIRLCGLPELVRRKRRHDRALPYIRGFLTTRILWTLAEEGFLDRLLGDGDVGLPRYAQERKLAPEVLDSLCEYLDALGLVRVEGQGCRPTTRLKELWGEPRGLFELSFGYEPILVELAGLLTGSKALGRDLTRRAGHVASGEAELGRQLPYPAICELLRQVGARKVLDLRCRDVEFLFLLCECLSARCVGIENDRAMLAHATRRLQESPFADRVEVFHGDMFDVGELQKLAPDADALTARDALHEHLAEGEGPIRELLGELRTHFPQSFLVVGEFCLQPRERLRRRPSAFVEHHLFHRLSGQVLLPAERWRGIFREAGYRIVMERVFDIVGHGYFALKPTG